MKTLLIASAAVVATVAIAAEPKKLTREEQLQLENLNLRAAIARLQAERIQEEQTALIRSICERAGVAVTSCTIDPQTLIVSERAKQGEKK